MHVYIIYHQMPHDAIKDYNEVVGVVVGTYEEAEAVVKKLTDNDPDAQHHTWARNYYWRTEATVLTERNCLE